MLSLIMTILYSMLSIWEFSSGNNILGILYLGLVIFTSYVYYSFNSKHSKIKRIKPKNNWLHKIRYKTDYKYRLKCWVHEDIGQRLKPGFFMTEICTLTAQILENKFYKVFVKVEGNFQISDFTCGFLLYNLEGKRVCTDQYNIHFDEICLYENTIIQEAENILLNKKKK